MLASLLHHCSAYRRPQSLLTSDRHRLAACLPSPISCVQPMEIYVDDEAKLTLHGLVQHYVVRAAGG